MLSPPADATPEQLALYQRLDACIANNDYMRKSQGKYTLWDNYRMTRLQVEALLLKQQCQCACCGFDLATIKWCIDHTGGGLLEPILVRGILCYGCNTGIGKLGNDIAGLRRAIAYLERSENGQWW